MSLFLDHSDSIDGLILVDILSRLRTAICWFCQTTIPNPDDSFSSQSMSSTDSWRYFPIPSDWQTEELKILSRRTFNLCVSCNVSAFSGWEKDEFDLKLMRRNKRSSFFGCNIKGTHVTGYFDPDKERELSSQWELVETLLPFLSYVDFDNAVSNVKKSNWYITAMSNLETFKEVSISSRAENEALNMILMFSKISLLLADIERDQQKQECLMKNAMSVIMPMSQFCLDQPLWDSDIGTNATTNDNISEWEMFAQSSEATQAPRPQCRLKPPSSKKSSQRQSKLSTEQMKYQYSPLLTKLVKVPVDLLLQEWIGKEDIDDNDDEEMVDNIRLNKWSQTLSGPAKLAMKRVDFTLKKLRQSVTIHTMQKSSLQVALALLELISTKECQNPILCLHQAAVFASQGSKGGSNDEEFKKPLPEITDCTPIEALVILGRADCLRAINFVDEAMFLCSFVGKVCRLHRDKTSEYPWTAQWRVVSVLTYTISVAIDTTINSLLDSDDRNNALTWENDVKAELSRGRSDAISLKTALSQNGFNTGNSKASHKMTPNNTTDHTEERYDHEEEEEEVEAFDVDGMYEEGDDDDTDDGEVEDDEEEDVNEDDDNDENRSTPINLLLAETLPHSSSTNVDFDEIPVVPV